MSIRILPQEQLGNEHRTSALGPIPPLLLPHLQHLYSRRAARLRTLAEENPLGDYLRFAAELADAQQQALFDHPLTLDLAPVIANAASCGTPPLDIKTFARTPHWQRLLLAIIAELRPNAAAHILPVLEGLEKCAAGEREALASALLAGDYATVGSDRALFLWAALSLYWAQMASQLPGRAQADYGEQRHFCPVCGSMPVSSVVHIGGSNGLRYLHCGLCESEWHMVRVKCSNCEESRDLSYWSLESEQAAVKAESCGDCGSYLKILYQEKEAELDAVADDLATLLLDAKMEEAGFARSSLNPFLFPAE
ncbi:formate dehydrogenase accessory protein FdhE [Edwardsiella tarda]|uniref:Protein FdhE homolog n=3 Tax=Edwardsiella tarda TaxID=636 RepID=A0A2A7TZC4_EDWTA|nr:formate dehydrogenase accessory protein FdhE [Edwardsiella tarda]AKH87756.1 formate dehydrogenase accessory protein FdhE [Edwardsiella tarda]ATI64364.1 formate dehydrogenase accessory protein FdhE [Edwardsiella tarda]EFE21300.1 formate dehydrogenase accessory protein FdhE [Edwardsiella tarda ATCC 23685]PEH71333.1 formate dehydrogenase accessory protein FdhE [Edwardsiella tarda]UAL56543.1 formate dehydrogenase accessory protein FdhE [Edwardsiella tarda]